MALDSSVKVVGAKQGAFKHQSQLKSRAGTSVVTQFVYGIGAPRDLHTGLSTGKREHTPTSFQMPIDSSSINFATAVANNETLTSVVFNFYQNVTAGLMQGTGPGSGGESKPFYTITLTNAVVSKYTIIQPQSRAHDAEIKNKDIHLSIDLTFQKIEMVWVEGGVSFMDDWTLGNQS